MSEQDLFPVPAEWAKKARVNAAKYQQLYGRSIADSGSFWLEQARRLDWIKRPEIAGDWSFDATTFHISWFSDGKLNANVPKGKEPDALTLDECVKLLDGPTAKKPVKKGGFRRKKA